jgi:hypothetical protein
MSPHNRGAKCCCPVPAKGEKGGPSSAWPGRLLPPYYATPKYLTRSCVYSLRLSILSIAHTHTHTTYSSGNILDGTLHGRGEAEYANGERFEGVSQRKKEERDLERGNTVICRKEGKGRLRWENCQ